MDPLSSSSTTSSPSSSTSSLSPFLSKKYNSGGVGNPSVTDLTGDVNPSSHPLTTNTPTSNQTTPLIQPTTKGYKFGSVSNILLVALLVSSVGVTTIGVLVAAGPLAQVSWPLVGVVTETQAVWLTLGGAGVSIFSAVTLPIKVSLEHARHKGDAPRSIQVIQQQIQETSTAEPTPETSLVRNKKKKKKSSTQASNVQPQPSTSTPTLPVPIPTTTTKAPPVPTPKTTTKTPPVPTPKTNTQPPPPVPTPKTNT